MECEILNEPIRLIVITHEIDSISGMHRDVVEYILGRGTTTEIIGIKQVVTPAITASERPLKSDIAKNKGPVAREWTVRLDSFPVARATGARESGVDSNQNGVGDIALSMQLTMNCKR